MIVPLAQSLFTTNYLKMIDFQERVSQNIWYRTGGGLYHNCHFRSPPTEYYYICYVLEY